mmetsp:Transcript_1507/g.2737  ORF Transcript_1507/g.2737 Transcript_1507/m.2737 type:complete len:377 (+) Transcript_1507:115-1245(+)
MNTSSTHGSSMNTSAHGSTIHRTSMTFRKSEPAKYDYEMPSRSQHGTATGTNDNNEEEDEDVPTTEAVVDETPETPFWANPTDDDDDDADAAVDTFFAKLFKRAEGKVDASTANNPANNPDNDNNNDDDTFFAKLFKKNDANADDDDDDDNASASIDRNYGDFLQYMDFLELVEFMTVLKTKTTGMPPRKIESKVEQLEKLMEETKGQTDLNDDAEDTDTSSTWKFLEFLMGKKNDEHPETKVHYRNFLRWLSSPPGTTPASFRSETKGPSQEDIWKEIAEGMAPKEERVSGKVSMAALWSYIATPPFAEGEESTTSASTSTTKRSGIWSWFGYAADATAKGMERKDADGGIEKARELEEDTNTSTGTASSDNHIV